MALLPNDTVVDAGDVVGSTIGVVVAGGVDESSLSCFSSRVDMVDVELSVVAGSSGPSSS